MLEYPYEEAPEAAGLRRANLNHAPRPISAHTNPSLLSGIHFEPSFCTKTRACWRFFLIARCFAEVVTVVLSALNVAGCRVYGDAFAIAPDAFVDLDGIAHGA